jgi:hypothetical protein
MAKETLLLAGGASGLAEADLVSVGVFEGREDASRLL